MHAQGALSALRNYDIMIMIIVILMTTHLSLPLSLYIYIYIYIYVLYVLLYTHGVGGRFFREIRISEKAAYWLQ